MPVELAVIETEVDLSVSETDVELTQTVVTVILESASTPGPQGPPGAAGVSDADFLVGTSHAGLAAEIVVGTTPGGELGGTWASPTVDATHSGSTHAAVQAAAEATAAAALSAHLTDVTDAHDATAISFVPDGSIAATTVQAAIVEVRDEAGGAIAPPVDLQGTDPDEAVLTLRADDAQVEHIMRVYNDVGDLAMDIDKDGRMDVISYIVQVPPDTGLTSFPETTVVNPGEIVLNGDMDTDPGGKMLIGSRFWFDGVLQQSNVFFLQKSGAIVSVKPRNGENDVSIEIVASADGLGNAIEMWDNPFNGTLFKLLYTGSPVIGQTAAPPDAALDASQVAIWFDDDDTAPALMLKAKTADGTLATATIPMTPS